MDPRKTDMPPARHLIGVWLVVFVCYMLTLGGHLFSPDDEMQFRTSEALVTSGTLAVAPLGGFAFASRTGLDGREYAQYGIGQPILAMPFVFVGLLLQDHLDAYKALFFPYRDIPMQFHNRMPDAWNVRFIVSWFNVFVGAFFAMVLLRFVYLLTGDLKASWMTALLYALGSMAWPQSRTFFSEPLAALCVLGAFLFLVQSVQRERLRPALFAGMCAGYAILTRLDSVFAFPGLAVYLALAHAQPHMPFDNLKSHMEGGGRRTAWGRRARMVWQAQFLQGAWKRWGLWLLPIAGAVGIFALLNIRHFGDLRPAYVAQEEGIKFGTPLLVGLHGFLASVGRGLFFFSPPLFLYFWSIRPFLRRHPALGWGLVVSTLCFLLVQAKWINWAGGWCWGPRHIFMIHWMLALPVCALLMAPRPSMVRVFYGLLMVLGVGVQVYGTSVNFNTYYQAHFRELGAWPRAMALYTEAEEHFLERFYRIEPLPPLSDQLQAARRPAPMAGPTGAMPPPKLYDYYRILVAPINDSVHIVQNSQWPGNWRCLQMGWHDNYWLHRIGYALQRDLLEQEWVQ